MKDAIAWPRDCAEVVTVDTTGKGAWPHATKRASIRCEHLGPAVLYARFASRDDLRSDLLRDPPSAPTCIAGDEVVIDLLEPGQFATLCRMLHGDRIDAVSTLPDVQWDGTIGGLDRAADARERRDTAAQARALRRYWNRG